MAVDSEKVEMLIKAGQAERFAHEGFYFWNVKIRDDDSGKWCFIVQVFRGVMHPRLGFYQTHKGCSPLGREHAATLLLKNYKRYVDMGHYSIDPPVYWKRSQWKNRVKK